MRPRRMRPSYNTLLPILHIGEKEAYIPTTINAEIGCSDAVESALGRGRRKHHDNDDDEVRI
jgi:hypothetical protein